MSEDHDGTDDVTRRFVDADALLRTLAQELRTTVDRGQQEAVTASNLAEAAEAIAHTAKSAAALVAEVAAAQRSILDATDVARRQFADLDVAQVAALVQRTNETLDQFRASVEVDREAQRRRDDATREHADLLRELSRRLDAIENGVVERDTLRKQLEEARALVPARKLARLDGPSSRA